MNDGRVTILDHSPMASAVNELMLLMQAVTEEYSIYVDSAVKALAEKVQTAIQVDATVAGIDIAQYKIKNAESEFDEMILDAASRLDSHRQWLLDEIRSLDRNNRDGYYCYLPSSNC